MEQLAQTTGIGRDIVATFILITICLMMLPGRAGLLAPGLFFTVIAFVLLWPLFIIVWLLGMVHDKKGGGR